MTLRYAWRNGDGDVEEFTDKVRNLTLNAAHQTEEASHATYTVLVDDPGGTFDVTGHRIIAIWEDDASDEDDQYLAIGYAQRRRYSRADLIEGMGTGGRVIEIDVFDLNTILSRRVFRSGEADRPAETDVARMQWIRGTVEASLIDDDRYLSTATPVSMDKVDYQWQTLLSAIQDCMEASGKNAYLTWFGDDEATFNPTTDPWGAFSLVYDFDGSDYYPSTARLTNVAADVDDETTFIIETADLERSPDRTYSGIVLPYDGETAYGERAATATAYARIDGIMNGANVKTAAKAKARIARYLADHDDEEDRLTIVFNMRPEDVNLVKSGMLVDVKFSHLADPEGAGIDYAADYVSVRILSRQVEHDESTGFAFYRIKVEATPAISRPAACPVTETGDYHPLGEATSDADGNVQYLRAGLVYPEVPTPAFAGHWHFPEYGAGGSGTVDYAGDCTGSIVRFIVSGNGTATIHTATYSGQTRSLTARLQHRVGAEVVVDETQTGETGDDFEFTVDTHGGVNCYHWIDVGDNGPACGSKWGFAGAEWAA
jgi:hypothetical protein